MRRREFLAAGPGLAAVQSGRWKPNIVVILADDLGYGDTTCYNPESRIPTPNIDRLAAGGVRFTDAHSASAVCSPTRYGLLTGRYAWRTWLQYHVLKPYDPPLIQEGRLTLAGMLHNQGYRTACVGKWHLGWKWPKAGDEPDFTKPIAEGPTTRGFDYYFGTDVPNFPPYCFIENDHTAGLPTARKATRDLSGVVGPMLPGWKFDEILPTLVERAAGYIAKQAGQAQPFFLYLPLTSPHEPIAPSAGFRGKSGISPLADFMMETDWAVGQVLAELDRRRLSDDTIVFFTADNGHATYTGLQDLLDHGHKPSAGWRGYKASIYEGGHRVPFIARWPGRIKAGTTNDALICLNDLITTCAELLEIRLPANAAEDSFSFLPALTGGKRRRPSRDAIVHHSVSGQFAIRQGLWKLILPQMEAPPGYRSEGLVNQLFHLGNDPAETRDLSRSEPGVVRRLEDLMESYMRSGRSAPAET